MNEKYIYRIYKSFTVDSYFVERLRVVYDNKSFVYCKIHGSDHLLVVDRKRIANDIFNSDLVFKKYRNSQFYEGFVYNYQKGQLTQMFDNIQRVCEYIEPLQKERLALYDQIDKLNREANHLKYIASEKESMLKRISLEIQQLENMELVEDQ